MVISHRLKLIYVKGHKVAGTSVELALYPHCGPDDVIASIDPFNPEVDETEYVWSVRNCSPKTDGHIVAADVRKRVTPEQWDDYLKAVTVRNPWDMMVSYFLWWKRLPEKPPDMPKTFGDFVYWNVGGVCPANRASWFIGGKPWADYHIRFEYLESDCQGLFFKLGIPYNGLPRLKTRRPQGGERKHYSQYYTRETRELVAQKYEELIECFGYRFEPQ